MTRHLKRRKQDAVYFCAPIEIDGHIAFHIECELDCAVEDDDGTAEPYLWVYEIYIDGRLLPQPQLHAPTMWSQIAGEIRKLAEGDTDLFTTIAERDGWVYRGLGGLDPDGHWRRSDEALREREAA